MIKAYMRSIVRLAGKGRQGVGVELFRLDAAETEEIELTDSEEEIASESTNSTAIMRVYENIGEDFWTGEGITAKKFANELDGLGSIKRLNIHINCLGGDCHTAQAIHSIISDYSCGKKTSYIDGVCASAATLIASAADQVIARHNTNYMVHYPWAICVGNAEAMSKAAEDLEKLTIPIVSVYKNQVKGKIDEEKIRELMANETWLTADEALEYGFVDKVRGKIKAIAKASSTQIFCSGQLMNFAKYKYSNFPNYPFEEIEQPKKENRMAHNVSDSGHQNVSTLIDPLQINLEYLSTNHANLVASIIDGERKRINDLDAMDGPGLEDLITAAKVDGRTPNQIAMECLALTRKQLEGTNQLGALNRDSANLSRVPAGDAPTNKPQSKKEKGIALLTKAQSSINKRFQAKTNGE
jgi:ATP-dependent Clp protease protease subunit